MSVQLEKIYYTAMRKYGMKLVTGTSRIWNNVSWIHTVEDSAVIDFLKGQELVIITGIKLLKEEELVSFAAENHALIFRCYMLQGLRLHKYIHSVGLSLR